MDILLLNLKFYSEMYKKRTRTVCQKQYIKKWCYLFFKKFNHFVIILSTLRLLFHEFMAVLQCP